MGDNPFVFPGKTRKNTSTDPLATPREIEHHGMTLRDWFAGQALAIAYRRFERDADPEREDLAVQAYFIADAMLAERSK